MKSRVKKWTSSVKKVANTAVGGAVLKSIYKAGYNYYIQHGQAKLESHHIYKQIVPYVNKYCGGISENHLKQCAAKLGVSVLEEERELLQVRDESAKWGKKMKSRVKKWTSSVKKVANTAVGGAVLKSIYKAGYNYYKQHGKAKLESHSVYKQMVPYVNKYCGGISEAHLKECAAKLGVSVLEEAEE